MIIKKGSEIPQSSPQHGECLGATVPGTPGRFYFSKDHNGSRTHQVHVCADGHPDIADKLAFRDYVRATRLRQPPMASSSSGWCLLTVTITLATCWERTPL